MADLICTGFVLLPHPLLDKLNTTYYRLTQSIMLTVTQNSNIESSKNCKLQMTLDMYPYGWVLDIFVDTGG